LGSEVLNFDLFSLKDRVAIVTGATSGIGKAVAIGFANFGANVVIVGRDAARANTVREAIEKIGRKAYTAITDVSKADDVARMRNEALNAFGRIDILVNSAGIAKIEGAAEECSEENWNQTIDTNLKGTFLCAQAVAPTMIKQKKGKIVNLASIDGILGVPREAAYCSSKGGIMALTRTLAVEWAKYNICVNAIAPMDVATEMHYGWLKMLGPEFGEYGRKRTPLSRARGTIAQPDDIAAAALFLASDASDWITGHVLAVDGGSTIEEELF